MKLSMITEKNATNLYVNVCSIEMTELKKIAHGHVTYKEFVRTIRFFLDDGEAITLQCIGETASAIEPKVVKRLKWISKVVRLKPSVYKGKTEEDDYIS